MIHHLSIQGLAIIDSLSIDFTKGFNVITGETGAGKSILIRALNLLMGAKANAESVRQGFPQAVVSGTFRVPAHHPASFFLANLGIVPDSPEDDVIHVILRRQLTAKGRSQCWINDIPVTSQACRELGATLIDVFGQHENQRLLDLSSHTHYLDSFLKDLGQPKRLSRLSGEIGKILYELESHVRLYQEKNRDRDYLSYRLESLAEFRPDRAEFTEAEATVLKSKDQIAERDALTQSLATLNSAGGESLAVLLREVANQLSRDAIESLAPFQEKADEIAEALDDLNYQIEKQLTSIDLSEGTGEETRVRLAAYHDLFRKYAVNGIDELLEASHKLQTELQFLETAEVQMKKDLSALQSLAADLLAEAKSLSLARRSAAASIKQRVEDELYDLAMKGCTFGVHFSEVQRHLPALSFAFSPSLTRIWDDIRPQLELCGEHGLEKAQFLLSSNPGEPQLPLAKIASGGELSRIMLALKKSLAADADTCVLVFDEIDSGISGRVADVVGKKMQELSNDFQVICISHLPQVAVYADNHLLVHKDKKGDRTETSIVKLSQDLSAKEIARLLSGDELSESSIANARTLIKQATRKKIKTVPKSENRI